MVVDSTGLSDQEREVLYANFVATNQLYYLALRKLAETSVPVRESLLVQSISDSKKAIDRNLEYYAPGAVRYACWALANDNYLVKKIKFHRRFVVLELTKAGYRIADLADEIIKQA